MKILREHIMTIENRILRISIIAAGALLALALGVWLVISYWPFFLLGGLATAGYYIYRRTNSSVKITEGVTITPEALSIYLHKLVDELEWDINPEIDINGLGDDLRIKVKLGFPPEPSDAAEFHSRVIYLQGYIARRLNDDFRIRNAKVEIEAGVPVLVGQTATS